MTVSLTWALVSISGNSMKKIVVLLSFILAASLWAQDLNKPSKKELFLRARDALKTSLENGDMDRAGQALDYLKANVGEGAPLTLFEEYLAGQEMGRFEESVKLYVDMRRVVLDKDYKGSKDARLSEKDALNLYLYRNLSPFDKNKADSLIARVDASDIDQQYKDLYAALIYSELVISFSTVVYNNEKSYTFLSIADTTCAEGLLTRSSKYLNENPLSEHEGYLKRLTEDLQKYMDKHREFRRDPLKHKYYTGGGWASIGFWTGFTSGDAMDKFTNTMNDNMTFDFGFRIRRFSLNFFCYMGMQLNTKPGSFKTSYMNYTYEMFDGIVTGEDSYDEIVGLNLGFTAIDSRFLRVEPFIGYATTYITSVDEAFVPMFSFGANVDLRLLASKPNHLGGLSSALLLRLKYHGMLGSLDVMYNDEELYSGSLGFHALSASLVLELW